MAAKTVALDAEAYELLKRQKRSDETFSDAVKRLARPRVPLTAFAGAWADLSMKERRDLDRVYAGDRTGFAATGAPSEVRRFGILH
jgi:predicted CopG family antitoxin